MRKLGPGLLYAGAAVGVSHIYQSTSAGARYGWIMIVAVVLANVIKYPFFEFGPRYAAATGKSLLHGYKNIGKSALFVFFILTIATMFIIEAAVTILTTGLAINLFNLPDGPNTIWVVSSMLLIVCIAILYFGRYKLLSQLMKIVMVLLAVTTIIAFILSFGANIPKSGEAMVFDFSEGAMIFLISLIGWMPAPLDISVWHSIWTVSDKKQRETMSMASVLFDFKVGYWGTLVLAILFVGLGTMMIYGTGREMPIKAGAFAAELIQIYTDTLGDWARPVIAIAAFTTMFSTTITCLDAFSRVIIPNLQLLRSKEETTSEKSNLSILLLVGIGAVIILRFFTSSMGDLIQFITILSFLAAPIIAFLNYKAVFQGLPEDKSPPKSIKILSISGMVFMASLSIYYLTIIS